METGNREKRPIRVTIANQSFTLVTSGDDREVLELANQIDELIAGIAARSSNADTARLAILACLHLADRLRTTEQELKAIRDRVEQRAKHFQGLLDQVME
ncbi:MAG: cell division protein ZapA [Bryobacterales bacterium]|nr:cell division protein ZapA [Bryobacterales bacterium]